MFPPGTPADDKTRRGKSQDPGQYGSDRNASETKEMNNLAAAASSVLREKQGPYGTAEQADDAHS
eukprot:7849016-Heterocapsa_arctica.AAC.1